MASNSPGRKFLVRKKMSMRYSLDNTLFKSTKPDENALLDLLFRISTGYEASTNNIVLNFDTFHQLCHKMKLSKGHIHSTFTNRDIICCLRPGLLHPSSEVRSAALKAIRLVLDDSSTVNCAISLRIDYFIVRSLDICKNDETERIQAILLVRQMTSLSPSTVPKSIINCLISIANNALKNDDDKMMCICLCSICEMTLENPRLVYECGGIKLILVCSLNYHQWHRIGEALISTIIHLLNERDARSLIDSHTDLEYIVSPFTDLHFRYQEVLLEEDVEKDHENRRKASKLVLIVILRSWSGILYFFNQSSSFLPCILGMMYLPNMKIRSSLLEFFYELFCFNEPISTDNIEDATVSINKIEMPESWKLTEGFVAEEGNCILPSLKNKRIDIVDKYLAVILSAMIASGFLEALVEVIVTSNNMVSIKATILMGDVLNLASKVLPHEKNLQIHYLSNLINSACSSDIDYNSQCNAKSAISYLNRMHSRKNRGPIPSSLFLNQILQFSEKLPSNVSDDKHCIVNYDHSNEQLSILVGESHVLYSCHYLDWNWKFILSIFEWPENKFLLLDDQRKHKFIKRLIDFFDPHNSLFSKINLEGEGHNGFVICGLAMLDLLVISDDEELRSLLTDFINNISMTLKNFLENERNSSDSIFSAHIVLTTCSMYYFLFIGRLSYTKVGNKILESSGIYGVLFDVMNSSDGNLIKLIISSLNASENGLSRSILTKGLTSSEVSIRLYCVSFLRVLLRAHVPFFSNWGIELLVTQLYDQSKSVAMEALSIISESCEDTANLHNLVNLRPSILHLEFEGSLLIARYASFSTGFNFLMDVNFISNELLTWESKYMYDYVDYVEELLWASLTTYVKSYDALYPRRSSFKKFVHPVYIPTHLFGEIVQHKVGFQYFMSQIDLQEMFNFITTSYKNDISSIPFDTRKMKAMLWALGHIGTSTWGLDFICDHNIIPLIVKISSENSCFSVRGTAYYVLCLLSSTNKGADKIYKSGWGNNQNIQTCKHTLQSGLDRDEFSKHNLLLDENTTTESLKDSYNFKEDKSNEPSNSPLDISCSSISSDNTSFTDSCLLSGEYDLSDRNLDDSQGDISFDSSSFLNGAKESTISNGFSKCAHHTLNNNIISANMNDSGTSIEAINESSVIRYSSGGTISKLQNQFSYILEVENPLNFSNVNSFNLFGNSQKIYGKLYLNGIVKDSFNEKLHRQIQSCKEQKHIDSPGVILPFDISILFKNSYISQHVNYNEYSSDFSMHDFHSPEYCLKNHVFDLLRLDSKTMDYNLSMTFKNSPDSHHSSPHTRFAQPHNLEDPSFRSYESIGQADENVVPVPNENLSFLEVDSVTSDKHTIRKRILHLIFLLSNSIGVTTNERKLLMFKEQFNHLFQDMCFYSEVCFILSNFPFSIRSRQFIQEIFNELPYSLFLKECLDILDKGNDKLGLSDAEKVFKCCDKT